MSMQRFEYREEMGFFQIQDKESKIPVCFVDNVDEADKLTIFYNSINPTIIGNKIILEWKDLCLSDIYLNEEKMDLVRIEISQKFLKNRKDFYIKQKNLINLKSIVDESTSEDMIKELSQCPYLDNVLNSHFFNINTEFVFIQEIALVEEEMDKILEEIYSYFPSVKARFIKRHIEKEFDLMIKF